MIKIDKKAGGVSARDPDNLYPIVFKCINCKSTIRRIEETNSYVLMTTSREVDAGLIPLCSFCKKLREYQGLDV